MSTPSSPSGSPPPPSASPVSVEASLESLASVGSEEASDPELAAELRANAMAAELQAQKDELARVGREDKNRHYMHEVFISFAEVFGRFRESTLSADAFDYIDSATDEPNGEIDEPKITAAAEQLGVPMGAADIQHALRTMDESSDLIVESNEFRDWWVLSGTKPAGDVLGDFKRKLTRRVARDTLTFDYTGFRNMCRDCQMLGRMEKDTRKIKPKGALLEDNVIIAFRTAVDPSFDPVEDEKHEGDLVRKRTHIFSQAEEKEDLVRKNRFKKQHIDFDQCFTAM